MAELLRIISLTKDPVCLARFLQDEVLPGYVFAVVGMELSLLYLKIMHICILLRYNKNRSILASMSNCNR